MLISVGQSKKKEKKSREPRSAGTGVLVRRHGTHSHARLFKYAIWAYLGEGIVELTIVLIIMMAVVLQYLI